MNWFKKLFNKTPTYPTMTCRDLSHTVKFTNKWICLDEQDRVCGVGTTLDKALKDATDRGYKMPTLMFVSDSLWA